MQRALAEPGQEPHGQEVEKSLEEPRDAVLRDPMPAGPMMDLDLADAKAAGMSQHRHEPVQLAVDVHLANHLGAVELEPAVVVVEPAAGQAADHPVEDPAGEHLVPRIVTGLLPAADHVGPLVEPAQEAGDLGRVVLEVGVEREDPVAPRCLESRRQRGRLAEVAAEPDRADPRILRGEFRQLAPRTVPAAIVHEDELERAQVTRGGNGRELGVKRRQAPFLVVDGDDDADHGGAFPVCGSTFDPGR